MMNDYGNEPAELSLIGEETDCSYLPGRLSQFEYRWAASLSAERYESLLAHGWRRFGRSLFRPRCRRCQECLSIRILLPKVRLSKSQRRCRNRNADVQVVVQPPTVTEAHIRLYNDYHRDMAGRRGWPIQETTPEDYYQSFVDGNFDFAREFLYLRNERLIGVGLVDTTERVQSSVYFIHDPLWRDGSPGTFSALSEIAIGQDANRELQYMGYYIRDCGSMNYKNRFRPHQFLQDYGPDHEIPVWTSPGSPTQL